MAGGGLGAHAEENIVLGAEKDYGNGGNGGCGA